jgi:transposase-like protein
MQRIYPSSWTPEEYISSEAHEQILPDPECPHCQQTVVLQRHGRYQRWLLTVLAVYVRMWVARFLCPLCRTTISYLPDFVFSYRPVQPRTLEAFLDGQMHRPDVYRHLDRLRRYQLQAEDFAAELIRTVGSVFGRPPPQPPRGLWSWLKKAGDGLATVTRRVVTDFRISLFKRYRCHQPAVP